MGAGEEVGKVASETVAAVKTNPSCLAAILLAAMFAVLTYVAFQRDADRRSRTVEIVLSRCFGAIEQTNKDSKTLLQPP